MPLLHWVWPSGIFVPASTPTVSPAAPVWPAPPPVVPPLPVPPLPVLPALPGFPCAPAEPLGPPSLVRAGVELPHPTARAAPTSRAMTIDVDTGADGILLM
jgi:hypothetical protein